jgi:hypothetical protein
VGHEEILSFRLACRFADKNHARLNVCEGVADAGNGRIWFDVCEGETDRFRLLMLYVMFVEQTLRMNIASSGDVRELASTFGVGIIDGKDIDCHKPSRHTLAELDELCQCKGEDYFCLFKKPRINDARRPKLGSTGCRWYGVAEWIQRWKLIVTPSSTPSNAIPTSRISRRMDPSGEALRKSASACS